MVLTFMVRLKGVTTLSEHFAPFFDIGDVSILQ